MEKRTIRKGDSSGNGRIVKFQMPSGLEIISLPTENPYGGEWDLGPTWNYVVMSERPFLVDTGRWCQGRNLLAMVEDADLNPSDLEFVLITHSHEDHDGGLAEVIEATNLKVRAHLTYDLLRKAYPDQSPGGHKKNFPAKCWHCFMPESFYAKNCLGYHDFLRKAQIETIPDEGSVLEQNANIRVLHLPGHSPDCLAVLIGEEAIIVGDILLPDITPWPTSLEMFKLVGPVLRPYYDDGAKLFGLKRYIQSLWKLLGISERMPGIRVFPAHRLYYESKWNCINLGQRINELLDHHIQRCAAILEIVSSGARAVDEIVREHFEESKLKGAGIHLARNEIISHCELLIESGDLIEVKEHVYSGTGSTNFENLIHANPMSSAAAVVPPSTSLPK